MTIKRLILLASAAAIAIIFLSGCPVLDTIGTATTGNAVVSITDAAVDDETITGIWLTVEDIQFNRGTSEVSDWMEVEGFEGPVLFNLLDYVNGKSEELADIELPSGQYNQIRFMVSAPEKNEAPPQNPTCYVSFSDRDNEPLFIPSGSSSGFKAVGAFQVPINGTVNIIADFDVRKGLIYAGNRYILKPTIRLEVMDEAGKITGSIFGTGPYETVTVYAYEHGTYDASEADLPAPGSEDVQFPNAVTSAKIDNQEFVLPFLSPKVTYDLVFAHSLADGTFQGVIDSTTHVDIIVEEMKATHVVVYLPAP